MDSVKTVVMPVIIIYLISFSSIFGDICELRGFANLPRFKQTFGRNVLYVKGVEFCDYVSCDITRVDSR